MEEVSGINNSESSIGTYEAIERYLAKTMSSQERVAFETHLKHNSILQGEVKRHQQMKDALSNRDTLGFRRKLQSTSKKFHSKNTSQNRYWHYGIAASLIIFLGIAFFLKINSAPTSEELFQKYFTPFPQAVLRSGTNTTETKEALKTYREGNYNLAVEKIQILLQNDPNSSSLTMCLGSAYLSLNKSEEAINTLNAIARGNTNWEEAQWYTALALLRMGNDSKLRTFLNKIIRYDGVHKEEAVELLERIEESQKK